MLTIPLKSHQSSQLTWACRVKARHDNTSCTSQVVHAFPKRVMIPWTVRPVIMWSFTLNTSTAGRHKPPVSLRWHITAWTRWWQLSKVWWARCSFFKPVQCWETESVLNWFFCREKSPLKKKKKATVTRNVISIGFSAEKRVQKGGGGLIDHFQS